jgi:hypothetical protein
VRTYASDARGGRPRAMWRRRSGRPQATGLESRAARRAAAEQAAAAEHACTSGGAGGDGGSRMDFTGFMAAFALAAFWVNTLLIAAAGLERVRGAAAAICRAWPGTGLGAGW